LVDTKLPSGDHSLHLNVPWFYCSDHIYELLVRVLLAKKKKIMFIGTTLLLECLPHASNITNAQGNCV